ncbi:MAG: hypothetical protein RL521_595 [Bacteroidota bacterium]
MKKWSTLILMLLALPCFVMGQKVGLVLSGGGAQGLAHIGVIKALEERGIPIDYIVGTSMGGAIGAMYASGMSTSEMEAYVSTENYWRMSEGKVGSEFQFYYREPMRDAGMLKLNLKKGTGLKVVLPTHYIDSEPLDWQTMEGLAWASLRSKENFDSLMIPFRCVAADVENKEEVVFRSGPLSEAIRASMTYPFYIPPIRIQDRLYYDGGIYNNFPIDIMCSEFAPDLIIGSNVSKTASKVDESDVMSQLENLIIYRDNPTISCEQLRIIELNIESGTFDFQGAKDIVQKGYEQAQKYLDELDSLSARKMAPFEIQFKRSRFAQLPFPQTLTKLSVQGLSSKENDHLQSSLAKGLKEMNLVKFEPRFYSFWKEPGIASVFPVVRLDKDNKYGYHLELRVKKSPPIQVAIGGNFSSRSINTGMVSFVQRPLKSFNFMWYGNSYFGRYYGSVLLGVEYRNRSYRLPISINIEYCQNRWDYYRSVSTFFEDTKPSFVVNYDRYLKAQLRWASSQHSVVKFQSYAMDQRDLYYQTKQFLSVDTSDVTHLEGWVNKLSWDFNTLNAHQYPTEGTRMFLQMKNVNGTEITIPGTTNLIRDSSLTHQNWQTIQFRGEGYLKVYRAWSIGCAFEGVHSNQKVFNNYVSSIIHEQSYQPIAESSTFFMNQYRGLTYVGAGAKSILQINSNLHWRVEAYQMNAYRYYAQDNFSKAVLNRDEQRNRIYSTSLVYQTLAGPLSLQLNYYERKAEPFSLMVHFGYILYNDSPRD